MRYTTRPLSDRTWLRAPSWRLTPQFRVTWAKALDLLERELDMIDGRDLVIEIDVREQDLRLDGMLRANARADQPAVVAAFESKHGPLLYRSDAYANAPSWRDGMHEGWQHNVYAVARTLESLRAVDRYGAVRSGEQYRGFRQIGGAPAIVTEPPMTDERAREVIASAAYPGGPHRLAAALAELTPVGIEVAIRRAQRNTHPDTRHLEPAAISVNFDDVQRAAAHLRGSSR